MLQVLRADVYICKLCSGRHSHGGDIVTVGFTGPRGFQTYLALSDGDSLVDRILAAGSLAEYSTRCCSTGNLTDCAGAPASCSV